MQINKITEKQRPPFRWLLIGPSRSGTTVHKDPIGTSAWNTSIHGYKLWILFKNKYPKWIVNGRQHIKQDEGTESIDYFLHQLPRILEKEKDIKPLIFIQRPNETIYVPGGWWHGVLNLTNTMAVTQNYMNSVNFNDVWRSLRVNRKIFAEFFLRNLRKKNPSLYYRARNLNQKDNFVMYSDRTQKNFVEDFSTTSMDSSDSDTSRESDYRTDFESSDVVSDSDSDQGSVEVINQSISEED